MDLRFVDCHSHVVPSRDDGAHGVEDGVALCCEAAWHGTALLFATPHVWPELTLTAAREADVRDAFAQMRDVVPLELRLGWELTPTAVLLDEDPTRYVLEGTNRVLIEIPFTGPADIFVALVGLIESRGLRPVVAHPERTEAVLDRPVFADELAERGCLLQVNASSLLGRHGDDTAELGWDLLERSVATVVASDGHRPTRPPHLDAAYDLAARRLGEGHALPMFDGTNLGVRPSQLASREELTADGATRARSAGRARV